MSSRVEMRSFLCIMFQILHTHFFTMKVLPVHKFQRSVLRIECHVIPLEPEVSVCT